MARSATSHAPFRIGKGYASIDNEGTYGTADGAAVPIKVESSSLTKLLGGGGRVSHKNDSARTQDVRLPSHVGNKSGEQSIEMGLWYLNHQTPTAAMDWAAVHGCARLVGYALGGVDAAGNPGVVGGKGTASSGSSTTAVLALGEGATFGVGQAVSIKHAAGSPTYEIAWVKSIATDTLTFRQELANPVAVGDLVWGGYTAFVPADGNIDCDAVTVDVISHDKDQHIAYIGSVFKSLSMECNLRELGKVDVGFDYATFDKSAAAADPTDAAWSYPRHEMIEGELIISYSGNTISYPCEMAKPEITRALKKMLDGTATTTEGIARMQASTEGDFGMQVRTYINPGSTLAAQVWTEMWENQGSVIVTVSFIISEGRGISITIPCAIIPDTEPLPADSEGWGVMDVVFKTGAYSGDTGTDPAANAIMAIGFVGGQTT